MQYLIVYTVEERFMGKTLQGAHETWTLEELCEMGLGRTVECALDRFGEDNPTTPLPIIQTGESELRVMAHRGLPIVSQ